MFSDTVITIARQYGSGGHEIGEKLAQQLGVKFYDRELLTLAAQKSGLNQALIENYDEMPVGSLLYTLSLTSYLSANNGIVQIPVQHQVFLAQFDAIREATSRESCVIVGRCANYVLKNRPHCVHVFVHAGMPKRVARIMERMHLSEKEAITLVEKTDKKRAAFHNFYADTKWGNLEGYNLALDTSYITTDDAAEVIRNYADLMK